MILKAGEVKLEHIDKNLPPPTRQQLIIRPKIGRPSTLSKEDKDQILKAYIKDKES
jgi:hypothetical protein